MDLGTAGEVQQATELNQCLKQLSEVLVQSRFEHTVEPGCGSILESLIPPASVLPDRSMQQLLRDKKAHRLVLHLIRDGHMAMEEMLIMSGFARAGSFGSAATARPRTAGRPRTAQAASGVQASFDQHKVDLLTDVFRNAFEFLTLFVSGNNTNKSKLIKGDWELLLKTSSSQDFGQSLLLTRLVHDYLPAKNQKITEEVVQHMLSQIENSGRQDVFLRPLAACLVCDGEAIRHQQENLMNEVVRNLSAVFSPVSQSTCHQNMKFQEGSVFGISAMTDILVNQTRSLSPSLDPAIQSARLVINLDESSFDYDCTLIEILAECCVGGASYAVNKCQGFLPMEMLLNMLLNIETPWRAKYACSRFLMNVYLKTDNFLNDVMSHSTKLDSWWEEGIVYMKKASDGKASSEEVAFVINAFLPTIVAYFGPQRGTFKFAPVHLKKLFRLLEGVMLLVTKQVITEISDLQVARCFETSVRRIRGQNDTGAKRAAFAIITSQDDSAPEAPDLSSPKHSKGKEQWSNTPAFRVSLTSVLEKLATGLDQILPDDSSKKAYNFVTLKNSSPFWYRNVQVNVLFDVQSESDTRRITAPARIWDARNQILHADLSQHLQDYFTSDLLKCNPSNKKDGKNRTPLPHGLAGVTGADREWGASDCPIVREIDFEYKHMMTTFVECEKLESVVRHLI